MFADQPSLTIMQQYLSRQHVFSLFTSFQSDSWPAICFYIFKAQTMSLYFLTETTTRHGELMLKNPIVAGTICCQSKTVANIQGIQFIGKVHSLTGRQEHQARQNYNRRFPVAMAASIPIWQLSLQQIKMVNNKLGFGTKLIWHRDT
ncbi:YhbP family protein [Arsenophonus apicola]|uniref:YhbP family protein n=1 Tax=Arsenophonus apicola TaxID=2879119 RepID=A0ABY8P2Y0_9GAMM|nr:YhbP family protein [Arsenophonus apicola]WGO83832.1 YhbP family protein [Arsenophonus apicola]